MIWVHDESHKTNGILRLILCLIFIHLGEQILRIKFSTFVLFKFFLLAGHMIWNYISGIICVWILLILSLWLSDTRISIFIQNIFLFYVWLFRLMSISLALNSFLLIRLILFVQIMVFWIFSLANNRFLINRLIFL